MGFSRFAVYDDEGCLMLVQRGLQQGHALYEEILTLYGPAPFAARAALLHLVPSVEWSHNTDRMISIAYYALMAVLFAAAAFRFTRSITLTALVLIASAYEAGFPLRNEPGHPQDLVALIIAAMALVSTLQTATRTRAVMMGGFLGALVMTKVNAGVLLGAALFLATHRPFRNSSRWPRLVWFAACAAAIALPVALMRTQLFSASLWSTGAEDHVLSVRWFQFAVIEVCAIVAWLAVREENADPIDSPPSAARGHAVWLAAAVAVVLGLSAWVVAQGTTVAGLVDGVVLRPLSYSTVMNIPMDYLRWYHVGIALAVAGVAFALNRVRGSRTAIAVAIVKVAVGAAVFLQLTPLGGMIRPHTDFATSFGALPALFGFLLLASRQPSLGLNFLGAAGLMYPLYAYPIALSQTVIPGTLVPLVAAVLIHQGAQSLALGASVQRLSLVRAGAGSIAVAVVAAGAYSEGRFAETWRDYRRNAATTGLPGAERLHLPREQYAQYFALTQNVMAHSDRFLALNLKGRAQLNSLYFWTKMDPPTYFNESGLWYDVLRSGEADAIREALDASARPAVVSNAGLEWQGPLHEYVLQQYQLAQPIGAYEIYLKKGNVPSFLPLWLLFGSRDFAKPSDVVPLINGTFSLNTFTLSLWFSTNDHGVLIGIEGAQPNGEPNAGYFTPVVYVGTDGILRTGLSAVPLQSTAPLNDGAWHHCVLQVSPLGQRLFVDGVMAGSGPSGPALDSLPMAQLGGGYWSNRPGADGASWSQFRGQIADALITPTVMKPDRLAGLHSSAVR